MTYQIVNNKEKILKAYDYLSKQPVLGADTETNGLDPYLNAVLLIQLGTEEKQFVFDIARLDSEDLQIIFKILTCESITKIFHNGKFDYKMIKNNFGVQIKNIADTMIAEQLLTKGVKNKGFGLAELAEKYRAGTLNKSIREEFIGKPLGTVFSPEALQYSAEDVRVLPIIYRAELLLAESKGLLETLYLENRVVPVLGEMELSGIYLDQKKWLELESSAYVLLDKAEKNLIKHFEPYFEKDLFGKIDLNFNSPVQIKPALEKIIGAPIESTEEKYLKNLDYPVIEDLLEHRKASKKISTYGKAFLDFVHPLTNKIHASYLQLGTDSGRMSCKDPNMQNIPHEQEYRTPFCINNPNYKIISADYDGQELHVLAYLAKEQSWIKTFENGEDLHSINAGMIFQLPADQCGKGTDYRTKAKTITFGIVYGLSAFGLAKQLKITKDEAQDLLNKFFIAFPAIENFLKTRESITRKLKCAKSPIDGRIRDLGNIDWDDWRKRKHGLNVGKNHPIQG